MRKHKQPEHPPLTLTQQKSDFTAEGAPPPVPAVPHPPAKQDDVQTKQGKDRATQPPVWDDKVPKGS